MNTLYYYWFSKHLLHTTVDLWHLGEITSFNTIFIFIQKYVAALRSNYIKIKYLKFILHGFETASRTRDTKRTEQIG